MANGKKNYFRHSFFARNDIKLLQLRDEIGVGFYFYYFSLLELCGEQSSDEIQDKYEFHDSTIRSLWGVNLKKSERVAHQMNAVGLLEFKKLNKSFQFRVPNLSKYLGKYSNKTAPNVAIKEKKRKEKKSKVKEKAIDDPLVLKILNNLNNKRKEILPSARGFSYDSALKFIEARLKDGFLLEDFNYVINNQANNEFFEQTNYKFYRPSTLFNKEKFSNYLAEPENEKIITSSAIQEIENKYERMFLDAESN